MPHVHGRPDNEQEWLDELLGRGPGDPDVFGYPDEKASPRPKALSQNKNVITLAPTNRTSISTAKQNYTGAKGKNL